MGTSKRSATIKAKLDRRKNASQHSKTSKSQPFPVNIKGKNVNNADRQMEKNGPISHYRSGSTIRRLEMYRKKLKKVDIERMRKEPHEMKQLAPDRRWFMNTRTINQSSLDKFRNIFETAKADPYAVVIQKSKTPLSLYNDENKEENPMKKALDFESFPASFHSKGHKPRKRDRLNSSFKELADQVVQMQDEYDVKNDKDIAPSVHRTKARNVARQPVEADMEAPMALCMTKGTSKRIWSELYKVVDSSDIICYVIDARDPMGTRCRGLEEYIKKEKPNKYQILVLNKVDLIPNFITKRWIELLSTEFPTIGYCTSMAKGMGRQPFINLIRQYSKLLKDHPNVSVGFVGYPNVGKSSLINSVRNKVVCKVAPVPGETKVWQYISLTNRVHLIDCPGVVPSDPNDQIDLVLKGVVRAEKLEEPECYIDAILERVGTDAVRKRYKFKNSERWEEGDSMDFLDVLGRKLGKLKKGGDVEIPVTARRVIHDFQRGKLPFYMLPPNLRDFNEEDNDDEEVDNSIVKSDEVMEEDNGNALEE